MNQSFGYRDVSEQSADELRYRLMASPSGRQIASDGSFVDEIVSWDPTGDTTHVYPDGGAVLYVRVGTIERWSYTRATGWQMA